MEKNKSGHEYIGYESRGYHLKYSIRKGLVKTVRFQERAEGGEEVSPVAV